MKHLILAMTLLFALPAWADMNFHNQDGKPISINEFKNKWLVINYWASWCDTCREEIPELNSFYKNIKDKNVAFYSVNYDHLTDSSLQDAINETGIKFPVLQEDPANLFHLGQMEALPITFIINPEGEVVKRLVGANTESSLTELMTYLQDKPAHAATA